MCDDAVDHQERIAVRQRLEDRRYRPPRASSLSAIGVVPLMSSTPARTRRRGLRAACASGARRVATSRSHSRAGLAGVPPQCAPAGTSCIDAARRRDLRAFADRDVVREPQLPAQHHEIPERHAAGDAGLRHDARNGGRSGRCARSGRDCRSWCPRRSRCRGSRRGRSCVLAPISTSSWMMTRPTCGTLRWPARAHQIAEAVLADAAAGMDDDAVADQRMRRSVALAPIAQSRPIRTSGSDHRARRRSPCRRRSPRAARSPRRDRPSRRFSSARRRMDDSAGRHAARRRTARTAAARRGNSVARDRDEGAIGRAHAQHADVLPGACAAKRSVVRQTPRLGRRRSWSHISALSRNARSPGRGAIERRDRR